MTELKAIVDRARATVTLILLPTSTVNYITRSDANGTRDVRTRVGDLPRSAAGSAAVIVDSELALSGPVQYRTDTGDVTAWVDLARDGDGKALEPLLPRFTLPHAPNFYAVVPTVTGDSGSRGASSTLHDVIGREDPVANLGSLRSRRGTLDVVVEDWLAVQNLEGIVARGQVMHYRQAEHPGRDMYLVPTGVRSVPEADVWVVSIDYAEVKWPAGHTAGSRAWTFEDLAEGLSSFDELPYVYNTFIDLATGTVDQ